MLIASMSMPCSSMALKRSAPTTRLGGRHFRPSIAMTSGNTQCAWTSTVLTRRPFTTTSRRRTAGWACTWGASSSSQPQNAAPANAPAPPMKPLRVVIAFPLLFNHFVGASEYGGRHGEGQRLRGFKVDDQIESRWLLYGNIRRLCSAQNLVDKIGAASHQIGVIRTI